MKKPSPLSLRPATSRLLALSSLMKKPDDLLVSWSSFPPFPFPQRSAPPGQPAIGATMIERAVSPASHSRAEARSALRLVIVRSPVGGYWGLSDAMLHYSNRRIRP